VTIQLDAPGDNARRDRWGRYLVVPPGGNKPQGYTRATTVAKALDDTSNLMKWANRMTAIGLAQRPDLLALVQAADPDDRNELDKVCERAKEAGGATARRDLGTALHTMVEKAHADPAWAVPATYAADVAAVQAAITAAGYEVVDGMSEVMVVLDRHTIAGTSDLTLRRVADGRMFIADLKTGASVRYGALAWAIQLAVYACADALYVQGAAANGSEDQRLPMPEVDRDQALILHVQPGSGLCDVHALDIAAGAEALEVAMAVRNWRSRKGLLAQVEIEGGGTASTASTATQDAATTPSTSPVHEPRAHSVGDQADGAANPSSSTAPSATPVPLAAALDAVLHQARVAWLVNRMDEVKANAGALALMAQLWPADVPPPKAMHGGPGAWSPAQVEQVVRVLDLVEAQHHMPFGVEDPAVSAARAAESERRADAQTPVVHRLTAPPDDGPVAEPTDVDWQRRVLIQLAPEQQAEVLQWIRDAQSAGVPWAMSPAGQPTPLRRLEIARAALGLAQLDGHTPGDDTGPRAALALVIGDDAHQPVHRVGALLGTLTAEQATQLADVAESHRLAVTDGTTALVAVA
jgi:hypothetical protein